MEKLLRTIEKITPRKVYRLFQPVYHFLLAGISTARYLQPSRHIYVIGVTGTKGKSSTAEFVNAVLEASNKKTALLSTIRLKIGNESAPNRYKMTMPGRFIIQKFLHDAVKATCEYAVLEMTSEGARFYRHLGIQLDALIFTNLSPEHIESHGSFEKYKQAKLRLVKHLAKSSKPHRISIANIDGKHGYSFLIHTVDKNISYSIKDVKILSETKNDTIISYKDTNITVPLPGKFNVANALAAIKLGEELAIPIDTIKKGIESLARIRGRVEKIDCGQDFTVIVDYAHTDDSLRKLYEVFSSTKKIAVLGACGGGRDAWKRPVLGKIADEMCDEIIVTNEDPYDEDIMKIINEVSSGVTSHTPIKILNRRDAIYHALTLASPGDVVLITGKGTDPYIMGPNNTKEAWDDAQVAREELQKLQNSKS